MSLQAWYPLDGNLKNYGVGQLNLTATTAPSYVNEGKISTQALSTGGLKWTAEQSATILNNKELSIAFWIKALNTTSSQIFGTSGMNANNNRKFAIFAYPTGNDLHLSWMNDAASTTFIGGVWSGVFPTGVWTHCCITYNNPTMKVYINGILKATSSGVSNSTSFNYETQVIHNSANRYINDFRVYNHCLSPREVQYIAAGLIAHYPLKDGGIEATTNLAPYPTPGTTITPGWDVNLHPNAISVSSWASGYNSGVSNPQIGYHAYWKIIDGIPTMVFPDINNTLSLGHRWLGISVGGFQKKIGPSTTYTISFDAKANIEGKKVSTGYYYRVTGASSNNFHDGKKSIALTTAWKRYSFTFTTLNTLDTTINASIYIYGYEDSIYGISYVRNIQVELKDHATSYTPTSRQAIVEDCSGYARHGEIVGNITISSNSPRYSQSIYQTDGRSNYIKIKTFTMPKDAVTMSCWFKSNTTGYNSYQIPLSFNSANYELSIDSSGHFRNGFTINGSRQVLTTSHDSILDDKWHMITATYDGKTIRRYLDGKELTSYATSISGTLVGGNSDLYIGTYNSGGYANKNAYMSDVRIYASALNAAAIETLYQSRISFTEEKDVMAYDFIEDGLNHLKMTDKGLIHMGAISETMTAFNMPIKILNDGSAWARIHWLDVTSNKTWFTNASEVAECLNQPNRYSRMGQIENFIGSNGSYEFMLTYPRLSLTDYNRWKQTSSPNATTVTGFEKIHTAWDTHNGGIRKNGSVCLYNCDTGSTWFAPIGQYSQWTTDKYIPAADGSTQTETELWVRIDTLSPEKRISLFNDKYIQALHFYEI